MRIVESLVNQEFLSSTCDTHSETADGCCTAGCCTAGYPTAAGYCTATGRRSADNTRGLSSNVCIGRRRVILVEAVIGHVEVDRDAWEQGRFFAIFSVSRKGGEHQCVSTYLLREEDS